MTKSRLRNGDGDLCPLFPDHGYMQVMPGANPPLQWCPSQAHDGAWGKDSRAQQSRSMWPLYGLTDTVNTYLRRLDRAIELAGAHPDEIDLGGFNDANHS